MGVNTDLVVWSGSDNTTATCPSWPNALATPVGPYSSADSDPAVQGLEHSLVRPQDRICEVLSCGARAIADSGAAGAPAGKDSIVRSSCYAVTK